MKMVQKNVRLYKVLDQRSKTISAQICRHREEEVNQEILLSWNFSNDEKCLFRNELILNSRNDKDSCGMEHAYADLIFIIALCV